MNFLTIRELRNHNGKLRSINLRIRRLRESRMYPERNMDGQPHGGGNQDAMARYAALLDELERTRNDLIMDAEDGYKKAQEIFDRLPVMQEEIMRLRYIDGMPWTKVSLRSNISRAQCFRLHKSAIEAINAMQ